MLKPQVVTGGCEWFMGSGGQGRLLGFVVKVDQADGVGSVVFVPVRGQVLALDRDDQCAAGADIALAGQGGGLLPAERHSRRGPPTSHNASDINPELQDQTGKGAMVKRKVSNPLALAVLAALFERSMHPYELAAMLKDRGKEQSIRIHYGSLYTVVDALVRAGFIEPVETFREGRRPERTVYALTIPGRRELKDWLSEILRTPTKEYPEFEAGLSLMPVLLPEEVVELLKERMKALDDRIAEVRQSMQNMVKAGLQRLFIIETEYQEALLCTEQRWVQKLVAEFDAGAHGDLEIWRRWHATMMQVTGSEESQGGDMS